MKRKRNQCCPSYEYTRRQLLMRSIAGMGVLGTGVAGGMSSLSEVLAAQSAVSNPLDPRTPHFPARAKRVIMFFMTGGASHVDSFDPKPALAAAHDKPADRGRKWKASPWAHRPRGQSGLLITDLFPHIASCADDLCLMRSLHGEHGDHFEATLHMHSGSGGQAMPGVGAWVSYGLGTLNPNLPSHVVFAEREPYAGSQVWSSGFLPAYHEGTRVVPGNEPIPHLRPQPGVNPDLQAAQLDWLEQLNARHRAQRGGASDLAARMLTFKTAYSMQNLAPELFNLSRESDAVLEMYGVKRGDNRSFGWQCLMARRMAEAGVRFIELIDTGASSNWDAHGDIKTHEPLARAIDKPIAGLISDLKQRGMLEETLVVWTTEFGRTPHADSNPRGRGHHRYAFTAWFAGGGTKGGYSYGASDEMGDKVAENPVNVHDFHATILHLLGLDHERLTFHHAGRDFRLTDLYGNAVKDIIA